MHTLYIHCSKSPKISISILTWLHFPLFPPTISTNSWTNWGHSKPVAPNGYTAYICSATECHGVPWSSGLAHRICVLMAEWSECGFESRPRPWCLCPWAGHFTTIASLHPGVNGYLWGQSWLLCLISPICAVMAAIELYTPQRAEMVSGMIYAPYEQGE